MYICEAWSWRGDEESVFALQPSQHDPGTMSIRGTLLTDISGEWPDMSLWTEIILKFLGDDSFVDFEIRKPVSVHSIGRHNGYYVENGGCNVS